MSGALKCISPVDGTLYAVREALSLEAARQAVAKAHAGQAHWAARPLAERINLVQAAVDIIGQQNDDIVQNWHGKWGGLSVTVVNLVVFKSVRALWQILHRAVWHPSLSKIAINFSDI